MEILTPEKFKKRSRAIKKFFLEAWPAEGTPEETQPTEKQKAEIEQAIADSDRTLRLVFTIEEIKSLIKVLSPIARKSRAVAFIQEAEYIAHTTVMALTDNPRPIPGPAKDSPNSLKLAHARAVDDQLGRLLGREQRSQEKHRENIGAHLATLRAARELLVRLVGYQYPARRPVSMALEGYRTEGEGLVGKARRRVSAPPRVPNMFRPIVPFNFTDRQYGQDCDYLNAVAAGAAGEALEPIDTLIGALVEAEACLPKGKGRHRIHADLSRNITGAYVKHIDKHPGCNKGAALPDILFVIFQAIGVELRAPTKAAKAALRKKDPS